jgi:hypothetical protein
MGLPALGCLFRQLRFERSQFVAAEEWRAAVAASTVHVVCSFGKREVWQREPLDGGLEFERAREPCVTVRVDEGVNAVDLDGVQARVSVG